MGAQSPLALPRLRERGHPLLQFFEKASLGNPSVPSLADRLHDVPGE